jgi:hypothetical protein
MQAFLFHRTEILWRPLPGKVLLSAVACFPARLSKPITRLGFRTPRFSSMRRSKILLTLLTILACTGVGQSASFEPARSIKRQVRWAKKTIPIAVSTSLFVPNASIKAQSDIGGAIHRALATWSVAANINFILTTSNLQSVSPASHGDGVNLITVAATAENLAMFGDESIPARTRVFYDSESGEINEADIAINPFPYSAEGAPLEFSTDGSLGSYDLQSTLTHEIGHLLGLNHSSVMGATMSATQALNGTFGLPAISQRTLSESDRAAVKSIYGSENDTGAIKGRVLNNQQGNLQPVTRAHVWLEDVVSGRVMASGVTNSNGAFNIAGILPGNYRVMTEYLPTASSEGEWLGLDSESHSSGQSFRAVEIASGLRVSANKTALINYILAPPQNSPATLNPRLIGVNSELSTVPVSAARGTTVTVYLSGDTVDQVPETGLSVTSQYLTVDPSSLRSHQFGSASPVISFAVTIALDAPPGDYSVRLQSNSGEISYLVGALVVEPKQ